MGQCQDSEDPSQLVKLREPTNEDIEYLRNELADRFDIHNVENWSAPFLMSLIGLFDAQLFALDLEAIQARRALHVV